MAVAYRSMKEGYTQGAGQKVTNTGCLTSAARRGNSMIVILLQKPLLSFSLGAVFKGSDKPTKSWKEVAAELKQQSERKVGQVFLFGPLSGCHAVP